jgi:hypothetical protein
MEPVISLTTAFFAWADRDPETIRKYDPGGYYDDPRAQALARVIENDLGIAQVHILGAGTFGVASSTAEQGGDVLKITLDSTEVETGTVLTNTKPEMYPSNVVRVQGAWYVRKLRVLADSWFDVEKEEWHHARKRIGLLRMERVHVLDDNQDGPAINGLSEYVRYVKQMHKVWPHDLHHLSHAAIRDRLLQAGTQLEQMLLDASRQLAEMANAGLPDAPRDKGVIARDVARAIDQLRVLGIYAVDFHGGNVGWTSPEHAPEHAPGSEPEPPATEKVYKVFDIGMSSVGIDAAKPTEIGRRSRSGRSASEKLDEQAFSPPIAPPRVRVAELG